MTFQELSQPLRGIIPPVVTPLAGPDQLDAPALERLIDYMISGGVHGLFLLGSCGEGPSLSHRLRRELVDRACKFVDRRVPVLVGITDPCFAESMNLAKHGADAGADAVVLSAPYYYPMEQSELVAYARQIAHQSPLPVTLYNIPSLTRTSFELESIRQLMDEQSIVGLKDSSGDLVYFQSVRELTRQRNDWTLLIGQEQLLAEAMALGADGGVCGGANVWPQLFVQIYEASLATTDTAAVEQCDVLPYLEDRSDRLAGIYHSGDATITAPSVIKGLKAALAILGIARDEPAPPLAPLTAAEKHHVETILRELDFHAALAAQKA
jgi:2-dehydro-3-deoxy-D-pentonate aldolase